MEKRMVSVHAVTIHVYTIIIAVLALLVIALGLRYWHLRVAVNNYTRQTIMNMAQNRPMGRISDYGMIVATGAGGYVSTTDLQNYVTSVSKAIQRDVVVMDKSQKVLADTIASNDESQYTFDTYGEIKMTISDGLPRSFLETSKDYPYGISETVVPLKNAKGEITGAVLVSNTPVAQ